MAENLAVHARQAEIPAGPSTRATGEAIAKSGVMPGRRGRLPGAPKVPGSGRQKGTRNKTPAELREMILRRGRPIEFLCDVAAGLRVRVGPQAGPGKPEYFYPDPRMRLEACKILAPKIIQDMRSLELSGPEGGPIRTADATPEERAKAWREMRAALLGQDTQSGRPVMPPGEGPAPGGSPAASAGPDHVDNGGADGR